MTQIYPERPIQYTQKRNDTMAPLLVRLGQDCSGGWLLDVGWAYPEPWLGKVVQFWSSELLPKIILTQVPYGSHETSSLAQHDIDILPIADHFEPKESKISQTALRSDCRKNPCVDKLLRDGLRNENPSTILQVRRMGWMYLKDW